MPFGSWFKIKCKGVDPIDILRERCEVEDLYLDDNDLLMLMDMHNISQNGKKETLTLRYENPGSPKAFKRVLDYLHVYHQRWNGNDTRSLLKHQTNRLRKYFNPLPSAEFCREVYSLHYEGAVDIDDAASHAFKLDKKNVKLWARRYPNRIEFFIPLAVYYPRKIKKYLPDITNKEKWGRVNEYRRRYYCKFVDWGASRIPLSVRVDLVWKTAADTLQPRKKSYKKMMEKAIKNSDLSMIDYLVPKLDSEYINSLVSTLPFPLNDRALIKRVLLTKTDVSYSYSYYSSSSLEEEDSLEELSSFSSSS